MFRRNVLSCTLVALFATAIVAAPPDEKKPKPATFDVKDVKITVQGPFVHDNLAVFLLVAKEQDGREYITLDQGLDKKLVTVNEKAREQVSELLIENKSDRFLFLQEGD